MKKTERGPLEQAKKTTAVPKAKPAKKRLTTDRREQKRAIDTKRAILNAALDEFAERGFDGASIRRIGERGGLDYTLITYHFRNKELLWKAVASYAFEEITAAWDSAIPPDSTLSPVERVRTEFLYYFRYTVSHKAFHNFMLREMQSPGSRLRWLAKHFLKQTRERILPQIAAAQSDGDLVEGDIDLLYYMLIGAASALSSLSGEISLTTGYTLTDTKVVDHYWTLLESIFFK